MQRTGGAEPRRSGATQLPWPAGLPCYDAGMEENPYRAPAEPRIHEQHRQTGLSRDDLTAILTGAAAVLVIVALAIISELF